MNVEIGTETGNFFSGNICLEFSVLCLCSVGLSHPLWTNVGTVSPPIGQCWNNLTSYLTEIPRSRGGNVNATHLVYIFKAQKVLLISTNFLEAVHYNCCIFSTQMPRSRVGICEWYSPGVQ
jgi:hypothetical protein